MPAPSYSALKEKVKQLTDEIEAYKAEKEADAEEIKRLQETLSESLTAPLQVGPSVGRPVPSAPASGRDGGRRAFLESLILAVAMHDGGQALNCTPIIPSIMDSSRPCLLNMVCRLSTVVFQKARASGVPNAGWLLWLGSEPGSANAMHLQALRWSSGYRRERCDGRYSGRFP